MPIHNLIAMGSLRVPLPKEWLLQRVLAPIVRPASRLIVGLIAIPILRIIRERMNQTAEWDEELEKDIEQWFRSSLVLFLATKNVESAIAAWTNIRFQIDLNHWYIAAGRLLLVMGVVETMPDQSLFHIIHPGPPKLHWYRELGLWGNVRSQAGPFFRGLLCQWLNRSSPVFAIMAAIFGGTVGWICFCLAITQYLIIGLVTSRDKALNVLSKFDREVARRRKELVKEFNLNEDPSESPVSPARSSTGGETPARTIGSFDEIESV